MAGKSAVNPRSVYFAPSLTLQILVAADVVGIGMGVIDRGEPPAVGFQDLSDFTPRVLVVAAVDQANVLLVQLHQPDLGWTLDVIAPLCNLDQFIHDDNPPLVTWIEDGVIDRTLAP